MEMTGLDSVFSSTDTTTTTTESTELGRDDFLNLLVVQLQNQDPLDPMESTEFSAQLAQFSSLEQLTYVNDSLETLIGLQETNGSTQALAYLGKQVLAVGDSLELEEGQVLECEFELADDADNVVVYIYDESGNPVKTIYLGEAEAGRHTVEWDGTDDSEEMLEDGTYTFEVVAADGQDEAVEVTTYMLTDITGVSLKDGEMVLLSGEIEIALEDVVEIREISDELDAESETAVTTTDDENTTSEETTAETEGEETSSQETEDSQSTVTETDDTTAEAAETVTETVETVTETVETAAEAVDEIPIEETGS